jgi:hypothetical protein
MTEESSPDLYGLSHGQWLPYVFLKKEELRTATRGKLFNGLAPSL